MKITRVRFKNINSLKGEHDIAIGSEPLSTAGLIAITGPTGSGKTTILDVITLALYNKIPRLQDRISKNFLERSGSVLTRNSRSAYAEVSYECASGNYTSKWEISTTRTGTLRDYDMEISMTGADTLIESSRKNVPECNEKLIGLSYDQFIRSILLAQGDFSKFLKAKKEERAKLLEKITGGWIYRELGKRAFEKYREHGKVLDLLLHDKTKLLERLLADEDSAILKEKLNEAEEDLKNQTAHKSKLEIAIERCRKLKQQNENLTSVKQLLKEVHDAQQQFESENRQKIEGHRSLLPIAEDLRDWSRLKTEIAVLEGKQDRLVENTEAAKQAYDRLLREIDGLLGKPIPLDNLDEHLSRFEDHISGLDGQMSELRTEFKTGWQHALQNTSRLDIKLNIENLAEGIQKLTAEQNKKQHDLETLFVDLGKTYDDVESVQKEISKLSLFKEKAIELKQLKSYQEESISDKGNLVNDSRVTSGRVQELPSHIENKQGKIENLALRITLIEKEEKIRLLQAKYEEDRLLLSDGEACPLCGSKDHPYSDHQPGSDSNQEELFGLKAEKENQIAQLAALRKELHTLEVKVKDINAASLLIDKRLLNNQKKIDDLLSSLPPVTKSLSSDEAASFFESSLTPLKDTAGILEKRELIDTLIPILNSLNEKKIQGMLLKKERENLYKGESIRNEINVFRKSLSSAENNIEKAERDLKKWQHEINEKNRSSEILTINLKEFLDAEKLNPEDAILHLLPPALYEDLNVQFNNLSNKSREIELRKEQLEVDIQEISTQLDERNIEQLNGELTRTIETIGGIQEKRDTLFSDTKFQEQTILEIEKLDVQIVKQKGKAEKWVLLNKYIGDKEGRKFSTFAQQLTLAQLLQLANKRLSGLTDRYSLDMPSENEDDSMIIIDFDMGSERRSVKTLSGGESFLISLSLALALSDLASKNIEINSLFIDEGFGTLDPETLDQTLDTLEKLQAESNKTIAVISHVDVLKERISTQIQLVPQGQGYSKIKIVSPV